MLLFAMPMFTGPQDLIRLPCPLPPQTLAPGQ